MSCSHPVAHSIDPLISLIISGYMLYIGIRLSVENFKTLIDFPLPEEDQLKIIKILAKEYEQYENLGNIYTRLSGKKRFIEIELYLDQEWTLKQIQELRNRLESALQEQFPTLQFALIPLPA